jgi:hypothetical protein
VKQRLGKLLRDPEPKNKEAWIDKKPTESREGRASHSIVDRVGRHPPDKIASAAREALMNLRPFLKEALEALEFIERWRNLSGRERAAQVEEPPLIKSLLCRAPRCAAWSMCRSACSEHNASGTTNNPLALEVGRRIRQWYERQVKPPSTTVLV